MINPRLRLSVCLLVLLLGAHRSSLAQGAPQFTDLVVFGDSLSDDGNIADQAQSEYGIRYPAPGPNDEINYTDGRFTDGTDTNPSSRIVTGVWHEQLAKQFLNIPRAVAYLDGGSDYAFGGAKTINGVTHKAVISEGPFTSSLTIFNMGKQVNKYLKANTPGTSTLFIVWGGGNDLIDDPSAADVTQTATNMGGLVSRLATAGARYFLVPNVPPLGLIPEENTKQPDSDERNQASANYKDALNTVLDQTTANLAAQGINITIYRLDVYSLFLDFIANPSNYGYVNVTDSSQGTAVNPNKYLFWDGIHPTTTGHYYLAAAAYSLLSGQPVLSVTSPISEVVGGDPYVSFYINQLGGDASAPLSVPYTVSGSATSGVDFEPLKGVRVLKAGKRAAQVKLRSIANPNLKDIATVDLTLATGAGYSLGDLDTSTILIDPSSN